MAASGSHVNMSVGSVSGTLASGYMRHGLARPRGTCIAWLAPARAVSPVDDDDVPPETPQQRLANALCADIDFNDDLQSCTELDLPWLDLT